MAMISLQIDFARCAGCDYPMRCDLLVVAPPNSKHAGKQLCRRCLSKIKPGPVETKSED